MDRYEYMTETHEGYRGMAITSAIKERLNVLGQQGWFLVNAHVNDIGTTSVEVTLCRKIAATPPAPVE